MGFGESGRPLAVWAALSHRALAFLGDVTSVSSGPQGSGSQGGSLGTDGAGPEGPGGPRREASSPAACRRLAVCLGLGRNWLGRHPGKMAQPAVTAPRSILASGFEAQKLQVRNPEALRLCHFLNNPFPISDSQL